MLLDLIFPKFCIGCNKYGRYICNSCFLSLEFAERKNIKPSNEIEEVLSIVTYNGFAKKIIKVIKYKLLYSIFDELYKLFSTKRLILFLRFKEENPNCLLQAIPLHSNRLKKRGFNQSHLLAQLFSKMFNYPIIDVLARTRDTKPQALMTKNQRKVNIQNAFELKDYNLIKNKNIILIDDVFTTGTTCIEAAKELKKHGSGKIFVFSFALD